MSDWTRFYRRVNALVKIGLDECGNTFGSAPCDAAGDPDCYYSFAYCKAKTKYEKGVRWLYFTLSDAPVIPGCLPYIKTMPAKLGAQIKPDQFLTAPASTKVTFLDPPAVSWANPGKPYDPALNNLETAGTFWKNLFARVPHYRGRPLEIWTGLKGKPLFEFHCYFRGVIDTVDFAPGEVVISTRDKLSLLEQRVPAEQDSENVLTKAITAGQNYLPVYDAEQFAEAAATLPKQVVIGDEESGKEYVEYTGRDLNQNRLTGCRRGCYGTAAVGHAEGCKVKNAVIVAAVVDPPVLTWPEVPGLSLDRCFLDLICNHGGIPIADTAFVDVGVSLAADALATGNLGFLGAENLPAAGVILVNDEVITYGAPVAGTATFGDVDARVAAAPTAHNMGQGTGGEAWHFVKFETGAGETELDRYILRMKRNGTISGKVWARVYADAGGVPGAVLRDLGYKFASTTIPQGYYGDVIFTGHLEVVESSAFWLAFRLGVAMGHLGHVDYEMDADADTSKFKHCADDDGDPDPPYTGIAGLPAFRVQGRLGPAQGLVNYVRGAYGTTPAGHEAGTTVYLSEFSREAGTWRPGALYKDRIEKTGNLKDLVKKLRESSFTQIWQGADGKIHFAASLFANPLNEVPHLTDALHLHEKKIKLNRDEDTRKTRICVYYAPLEEGAGSDTLKWESAVLQADVELESENYLAKKLGTAIYANWIYRQAEAVFTAANYLALYRAGAPLLTVEIDAKDALYIPEGSEVQITTTLASGPTGAARSMVRYFVLGKFMVSDTLWELLCLDISSGRDDLFYAVISDLPEDHDSYDAAARAHYAWIGSPGDPPAGNRVGAAMTPGWSIV